MRAPLVFVPAVLLALVAAPFSYHTTLAEPDLARMAAALVYGASTGDHLAAGMHYGAPFGFGYYWLVYALVPAALLRDPDTAARVINGMGLASGLLLAIACPAYLARVLGT